MDGKPPSPYSGAVDILIKLLNFHLFLARPRKICNFRWANSLRDAIELAALFADGQFTQVYGRITSRYNRHSQQRWENLVRKFDLTDTLSARMQHFGNRAFYEAVAKRTSDQSHFYSHKVDLTRIQDISTATTSADYLYEEISRLEDPRRAAIARKLYLAGYSRPIDVFDFGDWNSFRTELQNGKHCGLGIEDIPGKDVMLIAISYKGKEVKITRRMCLVNCDGEPKSEEDEWFDVKANYTLTTDFVDDFRWSQIVRSCRSLARNEGATTVRLWIDRLMSIGLSKDEQKEKKDLKLKWEEYALLPYAICPVVRVYDRQDIYYGTDFWRKLETVMGVAGRGVVVDDYMLRKYDRTIFFGPSLYSRLDNGISCIGGGGIYLRSVTLAQATAVMTDGLSVKQANEDIRTKLAAPAWKAWALRTIAEGAYSKDHSSMMKQQKDKFTVGYEEFATIAFWESLVSQTDDLKGNSYLDMSMQRSKDRPQRATWDGVLEWIGMMAESCEIKERSKIMDFLDKNVEMKMWTTTSSHVATKLLLHSTNSAERREIVVDLARFSTAQDGYVTAVAEATGLWGECILPPYLRFKPNPDEDQTAEVTEDGVDYTYKEMKVEFVWMPILRMIAIGLFFLLSIVFFAIAGSSEIPFLTALLVIPGLVIWVVLAISAVKVFLPWPWIDECDVGEALFDNLVLDSLYGSGVKGQYRRLKETRYSEIRWC